MRSVDRFAHGSLTSRLSLLFRSGEIEVGSHLSLLTSHFCSGAAYSKSALTSHLSLLTSVPLSPLKMLALLLSGRGRLIIHLTGWLLVALVTYYLILGLRPPGEALARTAMNIVFPAILFYVNARIVVNRLFERRRYWQWGWWSLVLWLGTAAVRVWAELQVFGESLFKSRSIMPDDQGNRMFFVTALIYFILMIFSALYQLLENRREIEIRHTQAQLNYLEAQINPHFLFNTLNNIYSAAVLQHPRTADMVLRLGDLLRYVTYDGQARRIPIDKEIAQIRAYIELFQLKSDKPLPIRFEVEGETGHTGIEPLLLLPLVENALKHGDLEYEEGGFLQILLRVHAGRLLFRVENSFHPTHRQKDETGGVGLDNIRQRLELNYPGKHRLDVREEGARFVSEMEVLGM